MTSLRRLLTITAALLLSTTAVQAQSIEDNLNRAKNLYENLLIEQARDLFLQVVNSPFEVTQSQRVTAYVYLGAAYASLAQQDSSITYFRAAIERDPFVDLELQTFTEVERQAFAQARQRSFRVGIRGIDSVTTLDPRTQSITITTTSTHDGSIQIEAQHLSQAIRFPIFEGQNTGVRRVTWNGTMPNGALAPEGTYALVARGQSLINRSLDSARVLFSIQHRFGALQDTLRELQSDELLVESHPASLATRDLAVGLGVAAAAFVIPLALGDGSLEQPPALSITLAGIATATGVFAYFNRRNNLAIPENIRENQRRRAERARINAEVLVENQQRLDDTLLIISPTGGGT
jgi:tetratricopeptide (TPR) repeat protein